ncbi:mitochondrial ribosomal death-associated protein 3-domain-containing protein [Xylariaceae sp. FL0594]|nr:mitochondrial ribosomal death-associated protein 3-domain-containing protein [Xylariaceae sp. FL0594]
MPMASTNCWRCLARPSQRLLLAPASTSHSVTASTSVAAFSTSTQRSAKPSKEPNMSKHFRAGKQMVMKNPRKPLTGRTPLPGERKAFRRRIQLSNDNALPVPGLDPMTPEALADPESVGKVVSIPGELIDQLRSCEAFKPSQNWSLFRAPHVLIRKETVDLAQRMSDAMEKKETLRLVVTGSRGSGKSLLGLQALATGFLNKWVVINIPEGQTLVDGGIDYSPIPNSEMFAQPSYAVKLMQAIYQTNQAVLSRHKVQLDHIHLPVAVSRGTTLAALLNATKEPEFAWPVFMSFWKELLLPGRPPVLFALDGLSHIMKPSAYRNPAFEVIHSHDLGVVRMYADALGGKTQFVNGAAVLGITSRSNGPVIPSVVKAVEQAAAKRKGEPIPEREPYQRYDERVFDALRDVDVLDVQGVDKTEARALMEYWAASGILRQRIDEKAVTEKWTMAGRGVLAEMERVALYDIRSI